MEIKLKDQIQRENSQLDEIKRNRDVIRNESEKIKLQLDALNQQIKDENISN